MKIFLIEAQAGEYDERTAWIICAFSVKATAEKYLAQREQKEEELSLKRDALRRKLFDAEEDSPQYESAYLKLSRIGYEDVAYKIIETKLDEGMVYGS